MYNVYFFNKLKFIKFIEVYNFIPKVISALNEIFNISNNYLNALKNCFPLIFS